LAIFAGSGSALGTSSSGFADSGITYVEFAYANAVGVGDLTAVGMIVLPANANAPGTGASVVLGLQRGPVLSIAAASGSGSVSGVGAFNYGVASASGSVGAAAVGESRFNAAATVYGSVSAISLGTTAAEGVRVVTEFGVANSESIEDTEVEGDANVDAFGYGFGVGDQIVFSSGKAQAIAKSTIFQSDTFDTASFGSNAETALGQGVAKQFTDAAVAASGVGGASAVFRAFDGGVAAGIGASSVIGTRVTHSSGSAAGAGNLLAVRSGTVQSSGTARALGGAAAVGAVVSDIRAVAVGTGSAFGRWGTSSAVGSAFSSGDCSGVSRTDVGVARASNSLVFNFGQSNGRGSGIVSVNGIVSGSGSALARAA
jgi:hypothetical protein